MLHEFCVAGQRNLDVYFDILYNVLCLILKKKKKNSKSINHFFQFVFFSLQVEAPFLPKVKHEGDTSHFDDYEEEALRISNTPKCVKEFADFWEVDSSMRNLPWSLPATPLKPTHTALSLRNVCLNQTFDDKSYGKAASLFHLHVLCVVVFMNEVALLDGIDSQCWYCSATLPMWIILGYFWVVHLMWYIFIVCPIIKWSYQQAPWPSKRIFFFCFFPFIIDYYIYIQRICWC